MKAHNGRTAGRRQAVLTRAARIDPVPADPDGSTAAVMLVPALLGAPGAEFVTLTKVDDLLLTITARSADDRPCAVLDPFGLAEGLRELVWDPIAGCEDPAIAERRAKAFAAGIVQSAAQSPLVARSHVHATSGED